MTVTVQSLVNIIGGRLLGGSFARVLSGGVGTDSRRVAPHSVFFALSGEQFDGNEFAADAALKGAGAVVVSRPVKGVDASCAVILVEDTLAALQQLAAWWRERLSSLCVIGITGSSGKTSTKDLVKSVMEQGFPTTATKGNFNNHIGLPLSILAAEPSDLVAVWEMGMNHAGELEPLCRMAQPQIGIITSIGSAHIEFMGSREAIAEEKATLARSLPEEGVMIFPDDCDFAGLIRRSTRARCVTTGIGRGDVRADDLVCDADGSRFTLSLNGNNLGTVRLSLHGRHMVSNALLAAACGSEKGLEPSAIISGLERARLTGGRLNCSTRNGVIVIDDTYNANPESMEAALNTAAAMECPGRRWAVLGRMGELGHHAPAAHARVGLTAFEAGFDGIVGVGPGSEGIVEAARLKDDGQGRLVRHFATRDEAAAWLSGELRPGDLVLFKGSRSAAIDTLITTLFPPETDL